MTCFFGINQGYNRKANIQATFISRYHLNINRIADRPYDLKPILRKTITILRDN